MSKAPNLNISCVGDRNLNDPSIASGPVTVHFRDLVDHLERYVLEDDAIVGCVAWLTHERILAALAHRECLLVVQKEGFLRSEGGRRDGFPARLRALYDALRLCIFMDPADSFRHRDEVRLYGDDAPAPHPVRCVGTICADRDGRRPLMHHKFMVFCRRPFEPPTPKELETGYRGQLLDELEPYAIWTGSFNPTGNGERSLENAVMIRDPAVSLAYAREFRQVLSLSEPLDWTSPWLAPEWEAPAP